MWTTKALQFLLFVIAIAMTTAEPPPQYGPPGYTSGFRPSSGFGGSGYSGGDGGPPQPFNFQYEVKDPQSGNDFGHQASSDGRQVQGEYQVLLPDGRRQIVKYTADDNGYNADVRYEGQARFPQGSGSGGYGGGGYSGGGYSGGGYSGGGKGGFAGYNYK